MRNLIHVEAENLLKGTRVSGEYGNPFWYTRTVARVNVANGIVFVTWNGDYGTDFYKPAQVLVVEA